MGINIHGLFDDFQPRKPSSSRANIILEQPRKPSSRANTITEQISESSSGSSPGDPDRRDEVSLDISMIANSLTEKLKIKKALSRACCIYRVPEPLRELNAKACAPRAVSIGPFHHGEENLNAMENHKTMYLQQFLELNNVRVEDLIDIIKVNETKLRDSYAETNDWENLGREDFAEMILLDAVFIIMLLLNMKYLRRFYDSGRSDHIFYPPFKLVDVLWDMCLLENQLPFFILKKLFERVENRANPDNCTLIELTCLFLQTIMDEWVKEDNWEQLDSSEVLHFVDFIRKCQQPKARHRHKQGTGILRAPTVPTATDEDSSKSNKAIDSNPQHTIEDSSTPLLKTKSIIELYAQTKPILKLTSTSNARGA